MILQFYITEKDYSSNCVTHAPYYSKPKYSKAKDLYDLKRSKAERYNTMCNVKPGSMLKGTQDS
jgi:hypothetical protein